MTWRPSEAQWLTEDVIAWDVDDAGATYTLHTSADGGLELVPGGVEGGESYELDAPVRRRCRPTWPRQYPHLAGYAAFAVPDDVDAAEALTGQLAVSSARGEARTGATGVQIAGVLDDLYAGAARDVELGVTWDGDVPTLRLWAPTARSVTLHRFADPAALAPGTTTAMELDEASGVWSVTGEAGWDRQYYLFEVEVFVPSTGAVERNVVTDPYSLSLSANSTSRRSCRSPTRTCSPRAGRRSARRLRPRPEEIRPVRAPRAGLLHQRRDGAGGAARDVQGVHADRLGRHDAPARARRGGPDDGAPAADVRHRHDRGGPRRAGRARGPRRRTRVAGAAGRPSPRSPARTASTGATTRSTTRRPRAPTRPTPKGRRASSSTGEMVQALNETELGVVVDVVYNHTASAGQAADVRAGQGGARLLPAPAGGRLGREQHLLREHRHRARDDGEAHGRLRRHAGPRSTRSTASAST